MKRAMTTPMLFPVPRSCDELPGAPVEAATEPTFTPDTSLPPQGYELRVADARIAIRHADEAGRRYAELTLRQLRGGGTQAIAPLAIRDWPDFPVRGFMLDISRNRVPTRQSLERTVEVLELCRINHFQLYIEHTFAYRDHEAVWRDASPLTADDLGWLDQLCAAHGIELSVNQNCFGHMERWLKHPEYRQRAEAPEGWRSKLGGLIPAAVLAPTQDNADFALGLVRELMSHLSTRRVNIGCDETFELGQGVSKPDVEARGRGRVYFEHLRRLIEPLHDEGFEVLFWADILRSHPELVAELPADRATALVWHYEAPIDPSIVPPFLIDTLAEFGVEVEALKGFSSQVEAFRDNGFPYWVCPGTSSWNSLVGRLTNAKINLLQAAEVGLPAAARGYLITDWGDNGHLQPPAASYPAIVYGAALSWCLATNRDLDIARVLDSLVFDDRAGELGGALMLLGELYQQTGKIGFNASPLFTALMQRAILGSLGSADRVGVEQVLTQLEEAAARVTRAQPKCSDAGVLKRELLLAIRLARHGAWRLAREEDYPRPSDAELRRDLDEAIEEQRTCWLMRSREGGLSDSLDKLRRTRDTY